MLIIDLFAGGGGASEGIRNALGRDPDIAVNHDKIAIETHKANHPGTYHYHEDIWDVSPTFATKGKPVGLLWGSPDCTHHSKAKGSAPTRDRRIRALAWAVKRWVREVRPRVIILENVEEFKHWGPLDAKGKIIKAHKGDIFRAFIRRLKRLDYKVEWRELRACDYGAPTIRKRLFLIARCDGLPIVWPEPTHGPGLIPHQTAADIMDWSIPCPSIFERKRPLVENTMRRIARGIQRYVIDSANPFIVPIQHVVQSIKEPLRTVTASPKGGAFAVAIPHVQRQYGHGINEPAETVTTKNKTALVSAIAVPHIQRQFGQGVGSAVDQPIGTVTAGGMGKSALVTAFLMKYYGTATGQSLNDPAATVTIKDRFGLVTVMIEGNPYVIVDIGMRMLSPRELFRAQGFTDDYKIDLEIDGRKITKTDQVRLCGNSVCPPIASAIVEANAGFMIRDIETKIAV